MSGGAERERHLRAMELFERACELGEQQRRSLLDSECGDDQQLRAEVESLLREDGDGADDLVPSGVVEQASAMARRLAERPPAELRVPEQVGAYRILRRIGQGGMSFVYEAEQGQPRRRVALKLLRAGLVTAEELARFRREVQLLGRLDHPGIAKVHEAGVLEPEHEGDDARPWFAMELVQGRTLTSHADEEGLGWRDRCRLLAKVCEAVHHAHVKGVIHRDLKPANVLVDAGGRPRVLDFGVASAEDEFAQGDLRTRQGVLLGTLQYMAPEQARGDAAEADVRSDVYALGLIAFELLAGRPARELGDESVASATRIVLEAPPPRLGQVVPALAGDAEAVVAKAAQDVPDHRYQSAEALGVDLLALAKGDPVDARPPTAWADFRRLVRRRKDVFAVAGIGVVLLAVLALYAGRLAYVAELARADEAAQRATAERNAARAHLAAAHLALAGGDVAEVRSLLAMVPEPMRGWTWRHLDKQTDDSIARWPGTGDRARRLVYDSETDLALWGEAPLLGGEERVVLREISTGRTLRSWALVRGTSERSIPAAALPLARRSVYIPRDAPGVTFRDEEDGEQLLFVPRCEGTQGAILSWETGTERVSRVVDEVWSCDAATGRVLLRRSCPRCKEVRIEDAAPLVFAITDHGDVKVFRQGGLEEVTTLRGHAEEVRDLALSPAGDTVVTASRDGSLRWWTLPEGREAGRLTPHRGSVNAVAWRADGAGFASSGADRIVRLWQAGTMREIASLRGHAIAPTGLTFSADGSRLLSVGRDGGRLWSVGLHADPRRRRLHDSYLYDVALSPDGERIATASWDGTVVVQRRADGELLARHEVADGQFQYPLGVGWSPDGRRLAVTLKAVSLAAETAEGYLKLLDAGTGELLLRQRVDQNAPLDVGFTEDGRYLLAGCGESWTVIDARELRRAGHVVPVSADLALLAEREHEHDSPYCKSAPPPGEPPMADGDRLLRSALAGPGFANCVALAPDGSRWAMCRRDRIALVEAGTGELLGEQIFPQRRLYAIGWSRDGSNLFLGTDDSQLRVVYARSLDALMTLGGHDGYIKSLVTDPRGESVFTASGDSTLRIWDDRSVADLHAGP